MQRWNSGCRRPTAHGNLCSSCPRWMHSYPKLFPSVSLLLAAAAETLCLPSQVPQPASRLGNTNLWLYRKLSRPLLALGQLEEDSKNRHYLPSFLSSLLTGKQGAVSYEETHHRGKRSWKVEESCLH